MITRKSILNLLKNIQVIKMVEIMVKAYIEQGATPSVKNMIQGESMSIDVDDMIARPEFVKEQMADELMDWLSNNGKKTKPTSFKPHFQLKNNKTLVDF